MPDRATFEEEINDSVQIGDILWFVDVLGGLPSGNPTELGVISNVGQYFVEIPSGTMDVDLIPAEVFFMFRKPPSDNIASVSGYYAEVTMLNNRPIKQELFSVGSEINISSK